MAFAAHNRDRTVSQKMLVLLQKKQDRNIRTRGRSCMKTIVHSKNGMEIAEILDDAIIVKDVQDFLDIVANSPAKTIILHKKNIVPEFFDLKTKIAGDILQKASNYRIKIGIAGDFEKIQSKSLKDFIYESNKTGVVLFKETSEEIIELFGRKKENY